MQQKKVWEKERCFVLFRITSISRLLIYKSLDLSAYVLPTEGAVEAAVMGLAAQTAGTEDVVAVQQTRRLVLLMAQGAYQGVDIATVYIA